MTKSFKHIDEARKKLFQGIGIPKKEVFVEDEFQKEAIHNITLGKDVLVIAPTGSGKTYIALESIKSHLFQKLRSVYTTPLKALSNTKYNELRTRFEPEYKVGLLTGDRKIDTNADVVVATTEIYRNELYSESEHYSLVVLDEVHYIADPQRGPVWEESIILTPQSSTLLMLSASISNYHEIADWISEVRGKECHIVVKKDRPVEIRYAFMHPEFGVIPLRDEKGNVFKEVSQYYSSFLLDKKGMRLKFTGNRGEQRRRRR
jgi:ATP-dependent RNA helicase HelY